MTYQPDLSISPEVSAAAARDAASRTISTLTDEASQLRAANTVLQRELNKAVSKLNEEDQQSED